MTRDIVTTLLLILMLNIPCFSQEESFDQLLKLDWQEVFADAGNRNWESGWFLDGQRATIKNMDDGMLFSAGPIANDNASHAVLWTKKSFGGDLIIEYDFTRMDDITKYVNIIYIQATGKGGEFAEDIETWSDMRVIPYMRTYFLNMNLWHVSYAAFGNEDGENKKDYMRARRYPVLEGKNISDTKVGITYNDTGLFLPGEQYHLTFIKKGNKLYLKVAGSAMTKYFNWDFSDHPEITTGRIGLRQMWTRCSKYANFSVSELR
jgi:hypothetical protein